MYNNSRELLYIKYTIKEEEYKKDKYKVFVFKCIFYIIILIEPPPESGL